MEGKLFAVFFYGFLMLVGATFIFLFEMGYLTAPELDENYTLQVPEGELTFSQIKCADGTAKPCS